MGVEEQEGRLPSGAPESEEDRGMGPPRGDRHAGRGPPAPDPASRAPGPAPSEPATGGALDGPDPESGEAAATATPADEPGFETGEGAAAPPQEDATDATRRVPRHHWLVRVTHWLAFVLLFGMVASGLQIYRAYPRFGLRGGPYYPNPLQDVAFPEWARLGGWLAGGINWHFLLMWPLVAVGLIYLTYLLISGEWRKLVFRPRDLRPAIEMQKYYLRLRKDHPPQGKHNALQKAAYTAVLGLGTLSVLTGLAIYKPVQLHPLTSLFGGFQAARYWHFWAVWLFVGFTIVHVTAVFAADPASLRAMTTGKYGGRFPSDEA